MPRVSQKDALRTRQKIVDAAMEILMTEGFASLTFTKLSQQADIGRSSINGHFKRKDDILEAIRPLVSSLIEQNLDFSSCPAFYDSWVRAIEHNSDFRNVIKGLDILICSEKGVEGLKERLPEDDPDVEKYIYMAIGYTAVNLPYYA